jgi:hypothetical protein
VGRSRAALALGVCVVGAFAVLLSGPAVRAGAKSRAKSDAAVGIEVSGSHLTPLGGGPPIRLLGVDRSGTEYQCLNSRAKSVFFGPTNAASIRAIKSWHTNAVRIPLNEDCWLGINGATPALSGSHYRSAIEKYVSALRAAGFYVILDLHWAAPGSILAVQEWPMADATHAPAFWRSVAQAFKGNRAVLFDLFNEPFVTSWSCWQSGCTTTFTDNTGDVVTYQTAGMQQLVDAVRSTGAANPIILGGLGYASDETQWATHEPTDPDNQLIVGFHTYSFGGCNNEACWDSTISPLAQTTPVVTTEFGESGCTDNYALSYMDWADTNDVSYLGWAWDATDNGWSCSAGPSLIVNYGGTPTGYGVGLRSHLAALAG